MVVGDRKGRVSVGNTIPNQGKDRGGHGEYRYWNGHGRNFYGSAIPGSGKLRVGKARRNPSAREAGAERYTERWMLHLSGADTLEKGLSEEPVSNMSEQGPCEECVHRGANSECSESTFWRHWDPGNWAGK